MHRTFFTHIRVVLSFTLLIGLLQACEISRADTLTPNQVAQYAYDAGFRGDGLVNSIAIAGAESSYVTNARNYNRDKNGNILSVDRGLWQINNYWHSEVSDSCSDDPACAARATYTISNNGTYWYPWSTYGGAAYNSRLPEARAAAASVGGSSGGGFHWPTDKTLTNNGNWLAADCQEYSCGLYHIGEDIVGNVGDPVYAVAEGTVVRALNTGDVVNGMLLWVEHRLSDGTHFYALYAHITKSKNNGDHVNAGEIIGAIAPYPGGGNHLHFGVRPEGVLDARWGRGALPGDWSSNPNKSRLDKRGFVAPYDYLATHTTGGGAQVTTVVSESDGASSEGAPGFWRYGTPGYWHIATDTGQDGRMLWTYTNGSSIDNMGDWRPNLPETRRYEVYVFIPRLHATTTKAHYEIYHADGRTDVVVNQYNVVDDWVSLGTYRFNSGTSGVLRLTDGYTENYNGTTKVGFDTAKWEARPDPVPPGVSFNEVYKNQWFGPASLDIGIISWSLQDRGGGLGGFSQAWDQDANDSQPNFPDSTDGNLKFGYLPQDQRQGKHTAYVRAWNAARQQNELFASGWYGYDALPPAVTITSGHTPGSTYTTPQRISWHIDDPDSGIKNWGQNWDGDVGSQFNTSDGYLDLPFGTHTLHIHTWDNVGNEREWTFGPYTLKPIIASLVINPHSVYGGALSTGTVTLTGPAPNEGVTITLWSNTGYAVVPSSVTVPAGASSKTFTVASKPVAALKGATITASFGGITTTAGLLIYPPALASLTLNPTKARGGKQNSVGTVTLSSPTPYGGTLVYVGSNTGYAVVPKSVTVPAGGKTAVFTVVTKPVGANKGATITATLANVNKSAGLLLTP